MSGWNGGRPPLPQTKTPAAWSGRARAAWTMLRELPPPVRMAFGLLLMVLAGLLAGCATNSPPSLPAANPAQPRLSEPLPSESYSDSARRLIESWRSALTGM